MEPSSVSPQVDEIRDFVVRALGPASQLYVHDPAVLAQVLADVRSGVSVPDAVLRRVHRAAPDDRQIADEFVRYVCRDLFGVKPDAVPCDVSRVFGPEDIEQSALADLWAKWDSIEFRSRVQFLRCLRRRLDWKAKDKTRRARSQKRQEDRRQSEDVMINTTDCSPSPASDIVRTEDANALAARLARLPRREREMFKLRFAGVSDAEIGKRMGLSSRVVRYTLSSATTKLRYM